MPENTNKLLIRTILKLGFGVIASIFLVSCNLDSRFSSGEIQIAEEINFTEDFLDLIQKVLSTGKDAETFDESDRESKQIEPVSFQELIEYLPESRAKWKAEKPEGQTVSFKGYSVSQVKRSYSRQDSKMTVSIFDWTFNSALYLPFLLTTEFSQESTEGYNRGVEIDGFPGREEYNYQTKNGSLNLLIDRRFFIRLDGDNIEESELREWWQKIDSKALSEKLLVNKR